MSNQSLFKIVFLNQGHVYEMYARQIFQSELYGFIEIEELVFGEHTQVIVDPNEEKLKKEFNGVKRSYIPLHSVIRIDEVEREGVAKIFEAKSGDSNVSLFPGFSGAPPTQKK